MNWNAIAAVLLAFEFFRRYRRKLIRNLLEVISSVIFNNKATDGIYKITCYKYAGPFYCFCWYRLRNFCMVLFRREPGLCQSEDTRLAIVEPPRFARRRPQVERDRATARLLRRAADKLDG